MRNRRLAVQSSVGLSAVLAVAAVILIRPMWFRPSAIAGPVMTGHPVLQGPVLGMGERGLTHLATERALLVVASEVPASARRALSLAMKAAIPVHGSYLWVVSGAARREWQHRIPALKEVAVKMWVPNPGISGALIDAAARASHATTRGPWQLSQGAYQVSPSGRSVRLAVDGRLSARLSQVVGGHGAVVILNHDGQWIGAAAVRAAALWRGRPVAMAGLPPMLALALSDQKVASAVAQHALSLTQMAKRWGAAGLSRGLDQLGYHQGRMGFSPDSNPALPSLQASVFSQGAGLQATPLELAQSYLPFLGSRAHVSMQGGPALTHRVSRQFAAALNEVLNQMPSVSVNGLSYRIWRPAGDYAVVLAPKLGEVAVLEGAAVQRTMSVIQIMGKNP